MLRTKKLILHENKNIELDTYSKHNPEVEECYPEKRNRKLEKHSSVSFILLAQFGNSKRGQQRSVRSRGIK